MGFLSLLRGFRPLKKGRRVALPSAADAPTVELVRQSRVNAESAWLLSHARNETSQFGEDGILARVFCVIGTTNRWCVEAGAWDGKYLSNTHALMRDGWKGVFVEANAAKFPALQQTYAGNASAHLLCEAIGLDPDTGLDSVLAKSAIPQIFDFLSLDIDGPDYYVWEDLSRYRPRVVAIEFNPTVPNDVVFIQGRASNVNQGCSLLALIRLAKRKNYELIAATACNAIFITSEEFEKFNISDNAIDAMYDPIHSARIFQGYDGTIFSAGMPRLLWVGREISFDDLQVLPPQLRRYSDALM